jgi:hypothetical protein
MPVGNERPSAGRLFGAALGIALVLTAVLVWLVAPPEGENAAVSAAYRALLWALRAWTALAWGFVIIAGLRWVRRQ